MVASFQVLHSRALIVGEASMTNVLLFDIVNVQNWPAALRSARSCSPCCKVASISERRRWPFFSLLRVGRAARHARSREAASGNRFEARDADVEHIFQRTRPPHLRKDLDLDCAPISGSLDKTAQLLQLD